MRTKTKQRSGLEYLFLFSQKLSMNVTSDRWSIVLFFSCTNTHRRQIKDTDQIQTLICVFSLYCLSVVKKVRHTSAP